MCKDKNFFSSVVFGFGDGIVKVWDFMLWEEVWKVLVYNNVVKGLIFINDKKFLFCVIDGIKFWDFYILVFDNIFFFVLW